MVTAERGMEMKIELAVMLAMLIGGRAVMAQDAMEKDVLKTSAGDLEITFIGHGSLMLAFGGKIIHVDRQTSVAVDLAEHIAAKTALQAGAGELAERLIPKLTN